MTVTTLCPGFTKTEFHERMDVAPRLRAASCGSTPTILVAERLSDFDKGKAMSIPGAQYKAIATATRLVPTSVAQRFQNLGRK